MHIHVYNVFSIFGTHSKLFFFKSNIFGLNKYLNHVIVISFTEFSFLLKKTRKIFLLKTTGRKRTFRDGGGFNFSCMEMLQWDFTGQSKCSLIVRLCTVKSRWNTNRLAICVWYSLYQCLCSLLSGKWEWHICGIYLLPSKLTNIWSHWKAKQLLSTWVFGYVKVHLR